jgi:hypothetical protein
MDGEVGLEIGHRRANPPEHTPAVFKSYLSYARLEETNGRAKNLVIARS